MAAPSASELEFELSAPPRRFRSVKHALLWYVAARSRKMPHAMTLEQGSAGTPSRRAVALATYAAVAKCLGPQHAADAERDEPLAVSVLARVPQGTPEQARAEADRRVAELVAHIVGSKTAALTDRLGLENERQTSAYVAYAERVIARRLRAVGLLEEGE